MKNGNIQTEQIKESQINDNLCSKTEKQIEKICNDLSIQSQPIIFQSEIKESEVQSPDKKQLKQEAQKIKYEMTDQQKRLDRQSQLRGYKKSVRQAQSAAFMCLLLYFTVKGFTLLIFYSYENYLKQNLYIQPYFVFLLVINSYLMLTAGKNPGYYEKNNVSKQMINIEGQQKVPLFEEQNVQQNSIVKTQKQKICFSNNFKKKYCNICQLEQRNRMKHCYSCGKCVMKFDHHCPWIGGCVGQYNHFKFWLSLLAHSTQAFMTFYICYKTLDIYKYKTDTQTFSSQFGVFALWSIFMFLYLMFAMSLLVFHTYLIACNITTRQMASRNRCTYLHNIKGNPYDQGLIKNIKIAMFPIQGGRQWLIQKESQYENNRSQSFLAKIWSNKYYDCC